MRAAFYLLAGAAVGFAVGTRLSASAAHCCQQVEQLVRADIRKRCGPLATFCEGAGDALGLFGASSPLLDLFGVTS